MRRTISELQFVTAWRMQAGESVCSSREGHLADSLRMHTAALRSFALRNSTDLVDGAHLGHHSHSNGLYSMDHSMHIAGKRYSHTDLTWHNWSVNAFCAVPSRCLTAPSMQKSPNNMITAHYHQCLDKRCTDPCCRQVCTEYCCILVCSPPAPSSGPGLPD